MQKTILIVLLFYSFQSIAQSQVSPATPGTLNIGGGSAAISSTFTVDWSIGESTIIETYYGQNSYSNLIVDLNWSVTSGILQPFDNTHIIFNLLIPKWTNQEIRLFPVPTPDIVNIEFRSITTGKITILLLSRDGNLLGKREFQINGNSLQQWDLTNKAAGQYYFKILLQAANGDILKQGSFKIEKL